eukprot:365443-Chlamydomonas_euryale.AAC.22
MKGASLAVLNSGAHHGGTCGTSAAAGELAPAAAVRVCMHSDGGGGRFGGRTRERSPWGAAVVKLWDGVARACDGLRSTNATLRKAVAAGPQQSSCPRMGQGLAAWASRS